MCDYIIRWVMAIIRRIELRLLQNWAYEKGFMSEKIGFIVILQYYNRYHFSLIFLLLMFHQLPVWLCNRSKLVSCLNKYLALKIFNLHRNIAILQYLIIYLICFESSSDGSVELSLILWPIYWRFPLINCVFTR